MLDAIRKAAMTAVEASNPVAFLFGIVTQINPLEVNVDQRFTLDADFLVQTEATTELRVRIGPAEYFIRRPLQVGDQVVLVRLQGGQRYLILDRVVRA
ncbi:DUF2577 domain-containing protein [Paenibacillus sp. PR3]|uniref:DUF2577 domain-containing protein n=1 Tax=Paenibacillus terricola TaxID=2763503 RepID=A0ABR8MNP4_9BACL|nr:DUF2577 domain-containing protein [Paenibacillus terricola]MBD3917636.1 DUF2577 domain-containing protein [Paenibacillus terricola]